MSDKNWNDEKELEETLKSVYRLNEEFTKVLTSIKTLGLDKKELPPIGIYYHNKVVDIYKYFQDKEVSYQSSALKKALDQYILDKMIVPAYEELNSFVNSNSSLLKIVKLNISSASNKKALKRYTDLANQLFELDIEKEAENALNHYLDVYMHKEWYTGGVNNDIDRINEELKKLKLDVTIKYRKDKKKAKKNDYNTNEIMDYVNEIVKDFNEQDSSNKHTR